MNENEQVEEMALVMCGRESCMTCTHFVNATKCAAIVSAKKLYNADYRKASEVAREIIKSLIDIVDRKERLHPTFLNCSWCVDSDDITDFISEIKKKYTEARNERE